MNRYIGLENIGKEYQERGYYVYFGIIDDDGKEYGFFTNQSLEGKFERLRHDYRQVAGTCQFSMDVSKATARKRLIDHMDACKESEPYDGLPSGPYDDDDE